MDMYLYKITVTDKNQPNFSACADEFSYYVGADSVPAAFHILFETIIVDYDPDKDAIVITKVGNLYL
jgi:hypothetical protein